MPRRTRSHQLEDLSRDRLHDAFNSVGWTVEDLRKDYGEDLLVRIFDNGIATPLSFFVQAKATDNIKNYACSSSGAILVPVEGRHAQHWERFWEPVILSLWDSKRDCTYWNCVQTHLSSEGGKNSVATGTDRMNIPVDKLLDPDGLSLMRSITKSRFRRFEDEQRGAQALIELLQKHLNLKVEYNPRAGVLLVTPPGESPILGFFGNAQERLTGLAKHWECSPEAAFETAVTAVHELCSSGTKELGIMRQFAMALKAIEDQGGDIDDFLGIAQPGSGKPRTKPGPPDIKELKGLVVSRPKRRRSRKGLPRLFPE